MTPTDPFNKIKKPQQPVAAPQKIQIRSTAKRGSKISPKAFLVGCLIFIVIFFGLAYAGLYFAISSTDILQNIGLEIDVIKNVLLLFAWLFFGVVFFVGFYMFVLNIYRLITVKAKSKIKYGLGTMMGFFVIMGTIVGGVISMQRINALSGTTKIQTSLLVVPYLETADGLVQADQGVPFIAPAKLSFQLNKVQFDQNILPQIGRTSRIQSYELICGNGQTITAGPAINATSTQGGYFAQHCLYLTKGVYDLQLKVNYETSTGENTSQTFMVTSMRPQAQISLTPTEGEAMLNDQGSELIVGLSPIMIDFRAQNLFTDLGLAADQIVWDFDGDQVADLVDNASFTQIFDQSKLHTVSYQLPGHPTHPQTWFTFDLRVIESELAQCSIDISKIDDKTYRFTPQFDEIVSVDSYQYTITDTSRGSVLQRPSKTPENTYTYEFETGGAYTIQVVYYTPEGLKGSCRSQQVTVGFAGSTVDFSTKYRQTDTQPYLSVGDDKEVSIDHVARTIQISTLPVILELSVDQIRPDPNASVQLYYAGRQYFPEREGVYEVQISQLGEYELEFVTTPTQGGSESFRTSYDVTVSRASLGAKMIVSPGVGNDPLEVTLDASVSDLFDSDDEIVYFSRDFDDGVTRNNVSQGTISHIYTYNTERDTGLYYPSVTVTTRTGKTDTYTLEEPIVVKKTQKTLEVHVDSHPTRQARINDTVVYSVQTDGEIDRIARDFGNGKTFGCDGRTCISAPVQYSEAGLYEARVEVTYVDDAPVVGRVSVRVY